MDPFKAKPKATRFWLQLDITSVYGGRLELEQDYKSLDELKEAHNHMSRNLPFLAGSKGSFNFAGTVIQSRTVMAHKLTPYIEHLVSEDENGVRRYVSREVA